MNQTLFTLAKAAIELNGWTTGKITIEQCADSARIALSVEFAAEDGTVVTVSVNLCMLEFVAMSDSTFKDILTYLCDDAKSER